jgi:hypothetical protein
MDAQTCEKLRLLALYLKHLPDSIPTVHVSATEYGFDFFTCEDDDSMRINAAWLERGSYNENMDASMID